MNKCTIYLLTNINNGKVYVGQTWKTLTERFDDGQGYKGCKYLFNAIKKHGKDKFRYSILEIVETQVDADKVEAFYIDVFNSMDHEKGYNLTRFPAIRDGYWE